MANLFHCQGRGSGHGESASAAVASRGGRGKCALLAPTANARADGTKRNAFAAAAAVLSLPNPLIVLVFDTTAAVPLVQGKCTICDV